MNQDTQIKKVLVLGSGALKIGQAGEFDYSGSQALKAMREEGIETVLINPNIATVQTSEGSADKIYFYPVTPYFVERVIKKERPQGILLAFGGQTALNCGVELFRNGILGKYGVKVLGTPVQAIMDTEDRDLFIKRLDEISVKTIKSHPANSMDEALDAARDLGYPLIIRSAYALGGLGSGFVDNEEELRELCGKAFAFSGQVLVEKSLRGWKEIEFEVVRDGEDRCLIVCNMENFDPLGIHTGESIVVAPCQSLSDADLKLLEDLSVKIVRHLGIVGECNIQFAYDSDAMDYRVIEVNARLSRSSALASKATGYPLAYVAAEIGLGKKLGEILNCNGRSAADAPIVDYIICKIPRWDLSKFHRVSHRIGSSMKSVGEVMSIGRSFEEAVQKGLRMIGQGAHGFVGNHELKVDDIDRALREPTDKRIFVISKALQAGYSIGQIHDLTKIDPVFLKSLQRITVTWRELEGFDAVEAIPRELLLKAKMQGFSDFQIQRAVYKENGGSAAQQHVRGHRLSLGIRPLVKHIGILTADHASARKYLYLTYGAPAEEGHDIAYENDSRSVIVLGSGAYRIGSSVEFDWCSVSCLQTIRREGWRGIMVNYNPETVSTDYDVCDRLYFDELTLERVLDICDLEAPHGVIVSVGGQIPNNLALKLEAHNVPILGTTADNIDKAEDRNRFSAIVDEIGVSQPEWREVTSMRDVNSFIADVGYPVLVRPSYVLSGAAMSVCPDESRLKRCLDSAAEVSKEHPVVISKFMRRCKEIDFDAVADHGKILAYAISEHIEYAGVHSGDATVVFPAQKLYTQTVRLMKKDAAKIAEALDICGPFNIQFLARNNSIKVIECNLRASRSFPFVSKVVRRNFIDLATRVMLGLHPDPLPESVYDVDYVGVKSAQFSFARLDEADPVLSVDMSSTGEVGCIGDNFESALMLSLLSVGNVIPRRRVLLSLGDVLQKADMLNACRILAGTGYVLYATAGSYKFLEENNIPVERALWPSEESDPALAGRHPSALELLHGHKVGMCVVIPKDFSDIELTNGYKVRRAAVDCNVPLLTNARLATSFIKAFCSVRPDDIEIKSWDEF